MNRNSLLLLTAAAIVLAGCSSTPTKVDKGAIHARSFSFVNRGGGAVATGTGSRQVVHRLIQDAITKDLTARGVSRTDTGGDVTVGYLVILGNSGMTERVDDYYGSAEAAAALHDKAHDAYTESKSPNEFEGGTLVIDIIDSRSFELLKRGYVTRPTLRNVPAEARADRVQEAVDVVLKDVKFIQ